MNFDSNKFTKVVRAAERAQTRKDNAIKFFWILVLIGLTILGVWADREYQKSIIRDAIKESQIK